MHLSCILVTKNADLNCSMRICLRAAAGAARFHPSEKSSNESLNEKLPNWWRGGPGRGWGPHGGCLPVRALRTPDLVLSLD